MTTRRQFLAIAGAACAILAPTVAPARQPELFTGIVPGVAVGGYDAVAYQTQRRPVRGRRDITLRHGDAEWRFASEANREAFRADPQRYMPRFGGYCAWAVSRGYTASGDPRAWRVVDGALYLNYNREVQRTWEQDVPGNIRRGQENWPRVLER